MTDCERIQIAAMAITDGDTPPVERDVVQEHLRVCEACRAAVNAMDVENMLPADLERATVSSEVWSEVSKQLSNGYSWPSPVDSHVHSADRNVRASWLALATCLLLAVGTGAWLLFSGNNGSTPDGWIVLAPIEQVKERKPMPPFTFEAQADVVGVAVMGQPHSRRGKKVVRMELVEVLKGEEQINTLDTENGGVPFGCIMPKNPKNFSNMYHEGERVAVYLKKHDDSWATLQMTHLSNENEARWKAEVESFFDVLLASEVEDPEQRFEEIFDRQASDLEAAKSITASRLTEPAYYALNFNPDPRAAKPIREMLVASVSIGDSQRFKRNGINRGQLDGVRKQVDRMEIRRATNPELKQQGDQPTVETQNQGTNARQADGERNADKDARAKPDRPLLWPITTNFPNTPLDLVSLLAKMHDVDSILPVMAYISRLSNAERIPFILSLPELCRNADEEQLRLVQDELDTYLSNFRGDKTHEYFRVLDRVRGDIAKQLE